MKALWTFLCCCLLAFSVFSDSILWMINDDHLGSSPSGESDSLYNMARIIVTSDGGYATYIDNGGGYVTVFDSNHAVMPAVYFSEETYGYTDVYPDGCGLINFDDKWGYNKQGQACYTTGEMWSLIPEEYRNNPATRMYIELCNGHIDESTWEAVVDRVAGKSNLYKVDRYTVSNSSGNDVSYNVLIKDGYHIENFTAVDGSHKAIAVRDDTAVFRDTEGHLLDSPGGNIISDPGSYYVAKYESTDQITQFIYSYGAGSGEHQEATCSWLGHLTCLVRLQLLNLQLECCCLLESQQYLLDARKLYKYIIDSFTYNAQRFS